jgi:hypothetical protein
MGWEDEGPQDVLQMTTMLHDELAGIEDAVSSVGAAVNAKQLALTLDLDPVFRAYFLDANASIAHLIAGILAEAQRSHRWGEQRFEEIWKEQGPGIAAIGRLAQKLDGLTGTDAADFVDAAWLSFTEHVRRGQKAPGYFLSRAAAGGAGGSGAGAAGAGGAIPGALPTNLLGAAGAAKAGVFGTAVDANGRPILEGGGAGGAGAGASQDLDLIGLAVDEGLEAFVFGYADKFGDIAAAAMKPAATAVTLAASAVSKAIAPIFLTTFEDQFRGLLRGLSDNAGYDPAHVDTYMFKHLKDAAAAGVESHLLSALAGIDVLGCGFDFGPVSVFLSDLGDYGRIIDPYIDAMVDAKIGEAARHKALKAFRPTHPSLYDLDLWRRLGVIDEPAYRAYLQEEGFADALIDKREAGLYRDPSLNDAARMYMRFELNRKGLEDIFGRAGLKQDYWPKLRRSLFSPPSPRMMTTLMTTGGLGADKIFASLQEAGYRDADAATITAALLQRSRAPYDSAYLSEIKNVRQNGQCSQKTFQDYLAKLGLQSDISGEILETVEMKRHQNAMADFAALMKSAFDRGQIAETDLEAALRNAGYDDFEVKVRTAAAVVGKYNRVTWKTAAEQQAAFDAEVKAAVPKYVKAYAEGNMTTSDLNQLLRTAGLLPEVADLTTMLAQQERLAQFGRRAKALGIPSAREQYVMGFATDQTYRSYLVSKGLPPGAVEVELAVARATRDRRISGAVRSQFVPAYEQGYRLGFVTRDELTSAWAAAGIDARAQRVRLDLLDAKIATATKGTMGPDELQGYIAAAAYGAISIEDFVTDMRLAHVDGLVQERALALVPVFGDPERHPVLTASDEEALLNALKMNILPAGNVLLDWNVRREKIRQYAAGIGGGDEPRAEPRISFSGGAYGV